ncbi:MAG: signal peptidase I [Acidimicrobiia bacterium]|nr:signal peptidase I [Acidimicrobiia bacterium]
MSPRLSRVALAGAVAAAAAIGLKGRWRRYEVRESSMEPGLAAGDYIIAAARQGDLVRGELVILPHPEIAGFELVKRVVGLPGESIVLSNGYVHVDGIVLAEPWADGPTRPDGEWPLHAGEVFVLGDNRPASAADSRTIGPVEEDTIRWRVVARYWPPASAGRLG